MNWASYSGQNKGKSKSKLPLSIEISEGSVVGLDIGSEERRGKLGFTHTLEHPQAASGDEG